MVVRLLFVSVFKPPGASLAGGGRGIRMRNHISSYRCKFPQGCTGTAKALSRWWMPFRLGVHLRAPLVDVVVRRGLERLALVDRRLVLHVLVRDVYLDS